MQPALSIIIVNWNSAAYLLNCLASIYQNINRCNCEIIVIDNASFDGCGKLVKAAFPQVIFIQSDKNLGFAGANNLAFERSHGRNILFLNPDTEIKAGALDALIEAVGSIPKAGMAGARLLNPDLTLQTTCVTALPSIVNQALGAKLLRNIFPKWKIWGMRPLYEEGSTPCIVEAISGACMLVKREVVSTVGAFTTDYFMYAEDMDLCAKVNKAGWNIYYVPGAEVIHYGGASSSLRENNFSNIVMRCSVSRYMELHHNRGYSILYRLTTAMVAVCRLLILVALLPLAVHPKAYQYLIGAFSKWSGILAWSIGATNPLSRVAKHDRIVVPAETRCTSVQPSAPEATK
jgi:N-acetylglucosaminyl-diphospho-decaprenol L-rhamnosyltransferase